jgi:hypothetical protein
VAGVNCGIIEGFYGRPWSWEDRAHYAGFLASIDFRFYLYAPKSDVYLRHNWQNRWPEEHDKKLRQLRDVYKKAGIQWGLGLSPFELYRNYGFAEKQALFDKISCINALDVDILCILFDDMQANQKDVAKCQSEIMHDICERSSARNVVVCPSYYSADPLLDKLFGQRPDNYLQSLGENLPRQVGVFWTGNKVVPNEISCADLQEVADLTGHTPWLWDNYPVNDGERASNFLHLGGFAGRDPGLSAVLGGHAVNPMNQAWLSKIPLFTLQGLYRDRDDYNASASLAKGLEMICGKELGGQLLQDLPIFQEQGLQQIGAALKKELIERYGKYHCQYSREIIDWLRGKYQFDPACLTG